MSLHLKGTVWWLGWGEAQSMGRRVCNWTFFRCNFSQVALTIMMDKHLNILMVTGCHGLLPESTKLLPQPILPKIYDAAWCHLATMTLGSWTPQMHWLIHIIMMIANFVAPNRCQAISNHHADSSMTMGHFITYCSTSHFVWHRYYVTAIKKIMFETDWVVDNPLVSLLLADSP